MVVVVGLRRREAIADFRLGIAEEVVPQPRARWELLPKLAQAMLTAYPRTASTTPGFRGLRLPCFALGPGFSLPRVR